MENIFVQRTVRVAFHICTVVSEIQCCLAIFMAEIRNYISIPKYTKKWCCVKPSHVTLKPWYVQMFDFFFFLLLSQARNQRSKQKPTLFLLDTLFPLCFFFFSGILKNNSDKNNGDNSLYCEGFSSLSLSIAGFVIVGKFCSSHNILSNDVDRQLLLQAIDIGIL